MKNSEQESLNLKEPEPSPPVPSSLSLIENCKTSFEKNKIPFKKLNYKSLLYKKRINYGRLENSGISTSEVRFFPELLSDEFDSLKYKVQISLKNEGVFYGPKDENFEKKMNNKSDEYLYISPSRREISLRKLLDSKVRELIQLFKNK
jgi:hypothetical protein